MQIRVSICMYYVIYGTISKYSAGSKVDIFIFALKRKQDKLRIDLAVSYGC